VAGGARGAGTTAEDGGEGRHDGGQHASLEELVKNVSVLTDTVN
jgi:hypothetical protein